LIKHFEDIRWILKNYIWQHSIFSRKFDLCHYTVLLFGYEKVLVETCMIWSQLSSTFFTCIFRTKFWRQKLQSWDITRESWVIHFCMKMAHIKCWWNWPMEYYQTKGECCGLNWDDATRDDVEAKDQLLVGRVAEFGLKLVTVLFVERSENISVCKGAI